MSQVKKYWWIKLKETFMTSDAVDFLMEQKNGANYVVLYQLLCLKTIKTNGVLERQIGEIIIPYDAQKIQRECKYFDLDTVIVALELYKKLGLIYVDKNGNLCLADYNEIVGSETNYAEKMRISRAKNGGNNVNPKLQKSYESVTPKLTKRKSIDIEVLSSESTNACVHTHGEFANVFLTGSEFEKLNSRFGESRVKSAIDELSRYILSVGKQYKNFYATLISWIERAVKPLCGNAASTVDIRSITKKSAEELRNEFPEISAEDI